MDEASIPKKPLMLGKKRPQGIEVVDADEVPLMLVYGESQGEARALAESMLRVLNSAKDLF